VTHSFDRNSETLEVIKNRSKYKALKNLVGDVERLKLPAYAVTRNYSDLFSNLYASRENVDLVVALMGDTKIVDAKSFERRFNEMMEHNYKLYACQAKTQVFWSSDKTLDRVQTDDLADFMPQLFFVDGHFTKTTRVFCNVPITNEYTTEQCLGDAFLQQAQLSDIGRLNKEPTYWKDYQDGIIWQALTNGAPGRP